MAYRYLILLVSILIYASCNVDRKEYVIGVSQCSEDSWREKLNEEIEMSTYLYNNVKVVFASANDDNKRQREQIDEFVKRKVDLLIVSPNEVNAVTEAVDRAYDKGVPVVMIDRKTGSGKYTAFMGADNKEIGRELGELLARRIDGEGRVVEIQRLRGSSAAIERHQGFMEAMSRYPRITVLGGHYAEWLTRPAQAVMDSILRADTTFNAVFAQNDRMAIGTRNAIEAKGIQHKIVYTGIDALPSPGGGLYNVRDGLLDASYIYPTRGDLVMQLAMNILEKRPFQRENILKGALVTKDNADVLLLQNEELSKQYGRLNTLHGKVDTYLTQYNHQRVYLLLFFIVMILLIVSFTMAYRNVLLKRRMAEKTADAKLAFFTNVSHEFRTPLTLIADPVERLLASEGLTEEQQKLLQLVRKNVNVLLHLVGEICDFRKIQKGKMRLRLSEFDLSTALTTWSDSFKSNAQRKHITVSAEVPDGLTIIADYQMLERICYNLLGNALKFTGEGGKIALKAESDSEQVILSVSDTGIGMTREEAAHAFERFYQAAGSTGGTGIGLSLVKAFVEMHHGQVSVESAKGRGTTFRIKLPLRQEGTLTATPEKRMNEEIDGFIKPEMSCEDNAELSNRDTMTTPQTTDQPKPILLVIDDNSDVRSYVSDLFAAAYDVRQAADGQTGIDIALKEVPDIVICDVMMPGMSGIDVCKRLKSEMATSHIPVLLLTARTLDDQRAEGYEGGADAYITKPFSGKVLRVRVKNLLAIRQQLKSIYSQGIVPDSKTVNVDDKFMADFHKIVLARIDDAELSVEEISREMGLSRVQMYRKVKALTGSTPVKLISLTRLRRAEVLLRQGGKTVAEVSYQVGFSSPSYFSKCFKDYFGRLPSGN